jgi:hypothetical protein
VLDGVVFEEVELKLGVWGEVGLLVDEGHF